MLAPGVSCRDLLRYETSVLLLLMMMMMMSRRAIEGDDDGGYFNMQYHDTTTMHAWIWYRQLIPYYRMIGV